MLETCSAAADVAAGVPRVAAADATAVSAVAPTIAKRDVLLATLDVISPKSAPVGTAAEAADVAAPKVQPPPATALPESEAAGAESGKAGTDGGVGCSFMAGCKRRQTACLGIREEGILLNAGQPQVHPSTTKPVSVGGAGVVSLC